MKKVCLKIRRSRRGSENESFLQEFAVPLEKEMTVLDALNHIKDEQDGTLSYRWSCRMGICGSCGMMVNGKPVLTCQTRIKDICTSDFSRRDCVPQVAVEPLRHFQVIKDLIVDIDDPMEKFRSVMPWSDFQKNNVLTNQYPEAQLEPSQSPAVAAAPRPQTPKQREKIDQTSQCIKCMLCYSACPIYGLDKSFIGPAAGALAYRYQADSRDARTAPEKRKRMNAVTSKDGVWKCSFVGECSVVCPKRVDPALALQRLKLMGLKHILTDG